MTAKRHQLTKKEALNLYFKMVLTRKTEQTHEELFQRQVVPVYTHLSLGQEAVGCGVAALLEPQDYVIGTHRGVPEFLAKGMSVSDVFLEYGGRIDSISGGRAGLHLHSMEHGLLPLAGALGTDFSLAVGVGLTIRNKGLGAVVVDSFGEGAAEQADFHPAMNMAMLWRLPVVFACCTNQFVEYHPYQESTCSRDIAPRARAYGMAAEIVTDGNDMFAVGAAVKKAVAACRAGRGPRFIEFKTYRLAPHHTGDQCAYRDPAEVEKARAKDPLPRAAAELIRRGWSTQADIEKIGRECDQIIDEAVERLLASPLPGADTVEERVYADQEGGR